jgi:predicted RNase H-like HicB family nuclease
VIYHCTLTRDDEHWLVEFPDCPGCLTFGESEEEALAMAKEALEGWLESHADLGREFPPSVFRGGYPIAPELSTR